VVGEPERAFYVELRPTGTSADPEAMKVSNLDIEKLKATGKSPEAAMREFRNWIEAESRGKKAVFVGFNACFDWQFVNWYFHAYLEENPFGFAGIDIKAYYMGMAGVAWSKTTSGQLPAKFQPNTPQTHNALQDARAQASIFEKMLADGLKRG
jgi:DNA polymerase III epsilon subunit-like protein